MRTYPHASRCPRALPEQAIRSKATPTPRGPATEPAAFVRRDVAWWIAAAVVAGAYIAVLGPGLTFSSS